MKEEEKKILNSLNYQIYKAERTNKSYLIQNAVLDKIMWEISKDLTIEDWRIIRGGEYWKIRDKLTGIEQKQFIRNCIQSYIKKK